MSAKVIIIMGNAKGNWNIIINLTIKHYLKHFYILLLAIEYIYNIFSKSSIALLISTAKVEWLSRKSLFPCDKSL